MKVTSVSGPGAVQDLSTPPAVRDQQMAQKFQQILAKQGQPAADTAQEHPVKNASVVGVEELGAIQPRQTAPKEQQDDSNAESQTQEAEVQQVKDPETERRFQQIARQERQLRAKIQQANIQLKQREEALKTREAAIASPQAPDLSQYIPKDRVKADALSVLDEAGVSWDELTQQVVNRQPTDPRVMSTINQLKAQIAELKTANETSQKTYTEQQQANYQAAIKQIRTDAKQLVYTDPEFETIKAMNATTAVVDLIEKTYAKDGIVLSVEDAAREVENYLVGEAMKITQIDKIKKRMAAANASRTSTDTKTQDLKQTQMKTLTNATSSTRPLTTRERAIAAAEGRLKP